MSREQIELSNRLRRIADMVSKGNVVCDVGCDHGFVSIYLIKQGIASFVYAMDVRKGPLDRAKEHIAAYNLEDKIETRLSDGVEKLAVGEAGAMVLAGMGGKLMQKILKEGEDKCKAMNELVLGPQSEVAQFRSFLRKEGYAIVEEDMVLEDGKFYPILRVIPLMAGKAKGEILAKDKEEQELFDEFGPILLSHRNPVLLKYLDFLQGLNEELLRKLKEAGGDAAGQRALQIEQELSKISGARLYFK